MMEVEVKNIWLGKMLKQSEKEDTYKAHGKAPHMRTESIG